MARLPAHSLASHPVRCLGTKSTHPRANTSVDIGKAKVSANNILGIRSNMVTNIDDKDQPAQADDEKSSDAVIELKNVSFCYPTRPNTTVLDNVSLRIHHGQTVGIVGESGSGKSTLLALLERFYDVQSGQVQVFGKSISRYDIDEYRARLAIVPQEPTLYKGTKRFFKPVQTDANKKNHDNRFRARQRCSRCR